MKLRLFIFTATIWLATGCDMIKPTKKQYVIIQGLFVTTCQRYTDSQNLEDCIISGPDFSAPVARVINPTNVLVEESK